MENVLNITRKLNWEFNEITLRKKNSRATGKRWERRSDEKHTKSIFSISAIFLLDAWTYLLWCEDPPVVSVKPDNLTINETGEFLLFCEYDANPASLASVRWLQNNSVLNLNQSRYGGGNPEHTALMVKNATRDDRGAYSCELTNQVGTGMSENGVIIDVQCEYHHSFSLSPK